ncbi:MAG: HlyD family secretion protein [Silicimonas sp.]|nr:HlyD family secretion protein [Silicimonas sp.]
MLGSRTIRIIAALFVCSAVAALLWPRATGYVSRFAVVNAPVLTVRAPVNGVIVSPTPGLAAAVARDDILFDLRATQTSRSEVARLRAELQIRTAEAHALREEERLAAEVVQGLRARVVGETESELVFLTRKLEQARANRRLNEIAWDRAAADLARTEDLLARGAVPVTRVEEALFAKNEAEAEIAADDAEIAALKVEIGAIEAGLPSPAGTGRRDFAHDRLDDMMMALADIRTRRISVAARRDAVAAELAQMRDELDGLARFRPAASANGVIWTASRQAGASVTLGSDLFQLLDCERRFIEVIFDERAFENLPQGTAAEVRLRGSDRSFTARVVSRHAAGRGAALSAVDAAVLDPYETGGVKVFLGIDPADITDPGVAAAFCDVGRTAEVFIRHRHFAGTFDPVLKRLGLWWSGQKATLALWQR